LTKEATVLSIAGSDPSGGAGIQADVKTIASIGVYGAAAITCITVQNSKGVQQIHSLPPQLVEAQIMAVIEDHLVTHIKIGMVGTIEIAKCIGKILQEFDGIALYDPVLAATTGESLLHKDTIQILKHSLLPYVQYLTPNRDELSILSGHTISSLNSALRSGRELLATFSNLEGLIVKGGHLKENEKEIGDYLLLQTGGMIVSKRKRINISNLHGTGCTFSSAFTSFLCMGDTPDTALQNSGEYMDRVIRSGVSRKIAQSGDNGPLQ